MSSFPWGKTAGVVVQSEKLPNWRSMAEVHEPPWRSRLFAAGSAMVIILAPAMAIGQPSSASQTGSPGRASPSDGATLGEVVVTANKRAEPVKTVADAIAVLPAQQLETAGVTELRDLNGLVPGLVVSGSDASGEFVIRGLSTGPDATPLVGFQIDGAPIGSVTNGANTADQMPEIDPSLISRIEVLKGPQGTLYGGSTLGGIVQFVTKKPSLDQVDGSFSVEGSGTEHGDGNYVLRASASAPLVQDKLGLQLSAYDDDLGGYVDDQKLGRNDFDYHHSYGGRAALLWQINPDFQVQLSDLYSHSKSYIDIVPYDATTHKPLDGDLIYNEGVLPLDENNFNLVSLNAGYDLHWATLSYVGTYQRFDNNYATDFTAESLVPIVEGALPLFGGVAVPANSSVGADLDLHTTKYTSELRLASPDTGRFRWLAGLFYNHEQSDQPQTVGVVEPDQNFAPAPLNDLLNYTLLTHLTEVAGFADLTYYIIPRLDVTGGIRVGHIDQDYRQLFSGSDSEALNTLFTVSGLLPTAADSGLGKESDTFETYLADLRYHLTANSMVYFRFATGYRPGGPNVSVPGVPPTFAPDTTKNYEVGWKTNFWGKKGYLDASAYWIDWDNIQLLTQFDGLGGTTNGGSAVSRGIEASLTLTPVAGLTLTGSGAYNDAHLTETIPGGLGNEGDRLPNDPKWTAAFGATYEWSLGNDWCPYVGAQVRYVDSRNFSFEHSAIYPDYVMPQYTTADLQAGVRHGPYDFQVFARNVNDERAQLGDESRGVNFIAVSRPRTVGASISAHF